MFVKIVRDRHDKDGLEGRVTQKIFECERVHIEHNCPEWEQDMFTLEPCDISLIVNTDERIDVYLMNHDGKTIERHHYPVFSKSPKKPI